MKILLIHNEYRQPGGEDVAFQQEAQLLSRFGHTVMTYRRSNREMDRSWIPEELLFAKRLVWARDTRKAVGEILAASTPDMVHVHNTFIQISPSVFAACRDFGVPVVQTLHNFRLLCPAAAFFREGRICEECVDQGLWRSALHKCYRNSRAATSAVALMLAVHRMMKTWTENIDSYIALSDFSRRKFIRGGLPPDRIVVKPNFVDPDPGERTAKDGYAIFVGRLSEEKGLRTLLRAWACLKNSIPLYIVGDGPLRKALEAYASEANLSNVSFLGRLPHEKTRKGIQSASFLVHPSECYENFPMAIAEAFACGTPVVCSGLGAMQEIVDNGRTGLHFEPGCGEDLARMTNWLWAHPRHRGVMGREARREFELKYSAERNYSMLMDIYEQALRTSPSGPLDAPILIEDASRTITSQV